MQQFQDKIDASVKDGDAKSKIIQQYLLRDQALSSTTATSDTHLKNTNNKLFSMLSNSKTSQIVDPIILAEINGKLQSLLTVTSHGAEVSYAASGYYCQKLSS